MPRFSTPRILLFVSLAVLIWYLYTTESAYTSTIRARTEAGLAKLRSDREKGETRDGTNLHNGDRPQHGINLNSPASKLAPTVPVIVSDEGTVERTQKTEKLPKPADEGNTGEGTADLNPAKTLIRRRLTEFLSSGPMVIFSKSYCPHSKAAKHLLLETYDITPSPLVVELDLLNEVLPLSPGESETVTNEDGEEVPRRRQTLGQGLQGMLGELTGRRTVPNIVVGGTAGESIGGNDGVQELAREGGLAERVRQALAKAGVKEKVSILEKEIGGT